MKKSFLRVTSIILLVLILCLFLSKYDTFLYLSGNSIHIHSDLIKPTSTIAYPFMEENRSEIIDEIYTFDPYAVNGNLKNGNEIIITKNNRDPLFPYDKESGLVNLSSLDWDIETFHLMANEIHKKVWGTDLRDWNLNRISGGFDCNQINFAPHSMSFRYFRTMEDEDEQIRLVSEIGILPEYRFARITATEYRPQILIWDVIQPHDYNISLTEALLLAEENGGADFRDMYHNPCSITLSLNYPVYSSHENEWRVDYSLWESNHFILFYINYKTGEITEILRN